MRRPAVWLCALLAACLACFCDSCAKDKEPDLSEVKTKMKVTSPVFEANQLIPPKYTADGNDVNPPLKLEDIPESAQSLVLIMDDPDAPVGTWVHWVVYDIPVTGEIAENSVPGVPGRNSWGRDSYGGPSPPSGTHRYFFKLYALDKKLDAPKGKPKQAVEAAMQGHIVAKGELVGLYKRQRK